MVGGESGAVVHVVCGVAAGSESGAVVRGYGGGATWGGVWWW